MRFSAAESWDLYYYSALFVWKVRAVRMFTPRHDLRFWLSVDRSFPFFFFLHRQVSMIELGPFVTLKFYSSDRYDCPFLCCSSTRSWGGPHVRLQHHATHGPLRGLYIFIDCTGCYSNTTLTTQYFFVYTLVPFWRRLLYSCVAVYRTFWTCSKAVIQGGFDIVILSGLWSSTIRYLHLAFSGPFN